MNQNSTVFVVDDDPGALESLRWMLQQANLRVKAFRSSQEFLDSYGPEEAACLVLDVRMPGMDGFALQDALRDRQIRLPIIFLTAYGDVPTCARAFRGGAADFLQKPVNETALLERIKRLIAYEEQRSNRESSFLGDRISQLSPAEIDVLNALIQAKSIKEIAREKKVSVQTVWRHQVSILHKTGVENHIELVRLAAQWQIQQRQQLPIADYAE